MRRLIGRIGRSHGIRGEMTVQLHTDEPQTRFAPGTVLFTAEQAGEPQTVVRLRWHSGRALLSLAGVDSKEDAERLRNTLLFAEIDAAATPEDEDEWYDHQLVGLAVESMAGTQLGVVREVLHLPAQDLLVVVDQNRTFSIPFVKALVPRVDLAGKRVVVDPPVGLVDDVDTAGGGAGAD